MSKSKIAKTETKVIDILKDVVGVKRKAAKTAAFKFCSDQPDMGSTVISLSRTISETLVIEFSKRFQVAFDFLNMRDRFKSQIVTARQIAEYIVTLDRYVIPFSYSLGGGERVLIETKSISSSALVELRNDFWGQFDKWYMENRKALRAVKSEAPLPEVKDSSLKMKKGRKPPKQAKIKKDKKAKGSTQGAVLN